MSKRTHILKALAEKLKLIDGTGIFKTNISNNRNGCFIKIIYAK